VALCKPLHRPVPVLIPSSRVVFCFDRMVFGVGAYSLPRSPLKSFAEMGSTSSFLFRLVSPALSGPFFNASFLFCYLP